MASPRLTWLDDDHPALRYQGEWEDDENLYLEDRHPVFGGKQKITTGNASVSFNFTGLNIRMLGRFVLVNTTGRIRPTWRCLLDDEEFDDGMEDFLRDSPPSAPENGFPLCLLFPVSNPNEPHTLRLEIEAADDAPFWIDAVELTPSLNSTFDGGTVWAQLSTTDPGVRLGSNWSTTEESSGRYALTEGSFVDINFVGTKAIWWGSHLVDLPEGTSQGSYSLNGEPPIAFSFTGRQTDWDPGYRVFFETEKVPAGQVHNLRVTHGGFEAPLVLNHLFIENGEILKRDPRLSQTSDPEPSTSPDSGPRPTSGANTSSGSLKSGHIGAIVGGVVGGIAFVLLLGCLLFFLKKKKQKSDKETWDSRAPVPFDPTSSQGGSSPLPSNAITHVKPRTPGQETAYTPTASSALSPAGDRIYVKPSLSGDSGELRSATTMTTTTTTTSPTPTTYIKSQPSSAPTPLSSAGVSHDALPSPAIMIHAPPPLDSAFPIVQPTYHQDSGIRLADEQTLALSEVPPSYTSL
ncbi:hypothetical protein FA15DRAFT_694006 [Coprinopsis marcescibilis]|uniref:Uncharacterized protein n=1 Tax=Coprinopsis marcescibilis TaxID=230819 RepID=A0A5C3KX62_COPMA|nr:hypothetical protein FA15DRAFT_694006 [Coprinopsis marcescibilis]